ncbi:MAG: hypothetical protein ACJ786_11620 [Catenulispora sp.]
MNSWINLNALWKIVVIGLLAGAGLPALFAVGLRALAPRAQDGISGTGAGTAGAETAGAGTAGAQASTTDLPSGRVGLLSRLIAVTCFAVVLAAMAWGIYTIVHTS